MEDIIYQLLFAYINKDEDFPHDFEVKAVEDCVKYLEENSENQEHIDFAKKVLLDIKNKLNY